MEKVSCNAVAENLFLKRLLRLDESMSNVNEADKVISKGRIIYYAVEFSGFVVTFWITKNPKM